MYTTDRRTVLTLDAGGTNFVFSAIRASEEIVEPLSIPAAGDDLGLCLQRLTDGFRAVIGRLSEPPVAISFAFPGPADYENGVIGDLPNMPAFRGGVALGPYLEAMFNMPVFINNDGSLFAYGEAIAGALPQINGLLGRMGSPKRYRNLIGLTLGTGFGCGVVLNGCLNRGDNGCGGDIWVFRNMRHPDLIVEESVSIRAVVKHYCTFSRESQCACGCDDRLFQKEQMTPADIFNIAEGTAPGNRIAAQRAFAEMGTVAGDAIADAVTLIDGVVVLGGGLTGATRYFMPALVNQLNSEIGMAGGRRVSRIQSRAFDMNDAAQAEAFTAGSSVTIPVAGLVGASALYNCNKRIPVLISTLGASRAIAAGAYAFALSRLDAVE